MRKTIFGFDVGLGSLGLAVRQGDDIVHADSLLIDAEVAKIKDQAERRRQKRTRDIHKQREQWWQKKRKTLTPSSHSYLPSGKKRSVRR